MKKILLLATMALAASSAFAVTDGATYETIDGLECKNLWIADRFHNNYDFARYSFMEMGTRARTACIAKLGETNEDIKILVGWSPTITEGETSNDYAKIVVINFLTGKEERVIQCTYEGKPITGLLCANQIGCDSFGHVWIAGLLSSTLKTTGEGAAAQVTGANAHRVYQVNMETGECTIVNDFALGEDDYSVTNAGRIDYCSLVGDVTLQQAPCVYMAAINGTAAPVYGFRAEQGATGAEAWQPLMNDGSYYAQNFTETYPEGQASWNYLPSWGYSPMVAISKDQTFSGQLFYVDGFTTYPTLYNTTGGIVESFANAPDMVPTETSTNGVAEFSIDDKDFVVYSLNQYAKGYDPDGKNLFCAARIAQLGEGQSFEGMKEMWVIPGDKGLGDVSDGGTRYHALDAVHIYDENGMDGVFVLTFKCYNGLAVYQVAPEGYCTPTVVKNDDVKPTPTDKSGIYMGATAFNTTLKTLPIQRLSDATKNKFFDFINGLQMDNATLLYYAVEKSIDALGNPTYPDNLSNAILITFTDGLDQGSLAMNPTPKNWRNYATQLHTKINKTKIQGLPLKAYTIGLKSADVLDDEQFMFNLTQLASDDSKAHPVTNIAEVENELTKIYEELNRQTSKRIISITVPMMSDGDKYRLTLDGTDASSSAKDSKRWIQGTFSIDDYSLNNIEYYGISSTSGTKVKGSLNGLYLTFTFDDCRDETGNVLDIKDEDIDEWIYIPSRDDWQHNVEMMREGVIKVEDIKTSAAIMFALDASKSLGDQFPALKTTATNFIQRLLGQYSAVEDIRVEAVVEPQDWSDAEVYNLQGVRVTNPTSGFYILRKGNYTKKILLR